MPSIKDKSTVQAIAREFTSNGRNKAAALTKVGYSPAYVDNYCGKIWGNVGLTKEIARLDAENQAKVDITRELLVDKMYDIVDDKTSTRTERTRAASLIADMIGAKREAAPNKEKEQAIAARMTKEDKILAVQSAERRTSEEARAGLRLAGDGTNAKTA